ncbi:MAG: ABC transporter permease [Gammaproteobacteria bacterium]|jgi:ABC-2 type transport system permease protein
MRFYQNYIALLTIIRREIARFSRLWIQTVLPPVITTLLYFVIFGHVIGRYVSDMGGVTYIEYIVPGLIMMAIMNNAYANVVSSFFGAKFQRFIDEMLVSPTSNLIILLGYLVGGIARGIGVGFIVAGVAYFFAPIQIHSWGLMLVVALLSATLFSLGGFINAVFSRKFDDITIIPTFVLTPMIYLGGVFYSIHLLPPVWQKISLFNPILYMINAFRYTMLGVSDIAIGPALLMLCGFLIVFFIIAWILLAKGVGLRN